MYFPYCSAVLYMDILKDFRYSINDVALKNTELLETHIGVEIVQLRKYSGFLTNYFNTNLMIL